MKQKIKKIILLLGDITILYLSLFLALAVRYKEIPSLELWQNIFWLFSLVFIIWIVIFYINELYNLHLAINNAKFLQLTIKAISFSGFLTIILFYLNTNSTISPKTIFAIFIIVFFILFNLWRRIFNWLLNTYIPKKNIAIIGYNKLTKELVQEICTKPHLGYRIAIILNSTNAEIENNYNIHVTNNISELDDIVKSEKIDTIIITENPHNCEQLRSVLFNCLPLGVDIVNAIDFYEKFTGKIPSDSINQMWFLEKLTEGSKQWFIRAKKLYDIGLALFILIVTAPFWPLIGIIIKLESKGEIFFKQTRAGKNAKIFTLIKFRTMKNENNDKSLTTVNDPRVTKFGNFLRKTRIDEIPQVLNVLIGDMSFIGPRPERPEYVKELIKEIPFYEERMLAKPGLTGWAQVNEYHSPSVNDSIKKLQYDLFYIKNRSIYLDLSIILKTIATVLSKSGI